MGVAALKQALPAEGGIVVSSDRLQDLRTKLFDIRCHEAFEAPTPLTPAAASPPATAPPTFVYIYSRRGGSNAPSLAFGR